MEIGAEHIGRSDRKVPMGPGSMLVESEEGTAELAAHLAAVAREVAVVGLHVAEHQVTASMAIVTVKASPVLRLRTTEHATLHIWKRITR